MANVDQPLGFEPVGHLYGAQIATREFVLTTGSTVYKGDPVIISSAGTVTIAAANMDSVGAGIAAEYVSDSGSAGGKKVKIYMDPRIIYKVQTTNSITTSLSNIFNTANMITYGAGNSSTGLSIMELDTPGTSTGDFIILGLYDSPDNAWGEFSKVLVVFNQHFLLAPYTGI